MLRTKSFGMLNPNAVIRMIVTAKHPRPISGRTYCVWAIPIAITLCPENVALAILYALKVNNVTLGPNAMKSPLRRRRSEPNNRIRNF